MNYLKCTFAGLLAVFVILGILPVLAMLAFLLGFAIKHGFANIGMDMPLWHVDSPVFWAVALAVFGAGFFWELRRLAK